MSLLMNINENKFDTNENEENPTNTEDKKEVKSELELKQEERYFKLINTCMLGYKDKLRIMKRSYEKDTIKIYVEILKNSEKELIHLKNATFYSHDELIDNLKNKFTKIVKTHHLN